MNIQHPHRSVFVAGFVPEVFPPTPVPPPPPPPKRGVIPPPAGVASVGGSIQDHDVEVCYEPPPYRPDEPLVIVPDEPIVPEQEPEADYAIFPVTDQEVAEVRAFASGAVERFWDPKAGLALKLTTRDGICYIYGSLFRYAEPLVDYVQRGDIIGYASPGSKYVASPVAAPPQLEAKPVAKPVVPVVKVRVHQPWLRPVIQLRRPQAPAPIQREPAPSILALVLTAAIYAGVAYAIFRPTKPKPRPRKKRRKRSRARKAR
jgi:hypothetical protein